MSHDTDKLWVTEDILERLPPEAVEIIQILLARIEELECRLGMNPQNSSMPPSSAHPHAKESKPKRKPSERKRGGQEGHTKHQRTLVPPEQVTETITLKPSHCRRCGWTLRGIDPEPHRHQVFELPKIRPIITEYQRHRLWCPCCNVSTTAALPDGVPQGQSGPRLVAFTALLMAYFRQSKRRTALFLEALCNIPCSAGLTVKHQNIATKALRGCYERMRRALPRSDAVAMGRNAGQRSQPKSVAVDGGDETIHAVSHRRYAKGRRCEGTFRKGLFGNRHQRPLRRVRLDSQTATLLGVLAARLSESDRRWRKSENHRPALEGVRAAVVS